LSEITKVPHVTQNSGNNEWYTPEKYIKAARAVMGRIDLDPASCDAANEIVQAANYYTVEDDGLLYQWKQLSIAGITRIDFLKCSGTLAGEQY